MVRLVVWLERENWSFLENNKEFFFFFCKSEKRVIYIVAVTKQKVERQSKTIW